MARQVVRYAWAPLLVLFLLAGLVYWGVRAGYHHKLYDALLYAVVVHQVAGDAVSQEDAARRLNQYVYLHVRLPWEAPTVDDSPADTLVRGYGYCDSVDSAFVRLLDELDLPAQVTVLEQYEGQPVGDAPHAVSEVYLYGDWRVFDTFHGLVPELPDGRPARIQDLATDPSFLPMILGAGLEQQWFQTPKILVPPPPVPSRVAGALESAFRAGVFHAPRWLVDRVQDLYLLLPAPSYPADPGYRDKPNGRSGFDGPDGELYYRARNYDVFMRSQDAETAYRQILERYPDSPFRDDVLYNLSLLELTQMNNPAAALDALNTLEVEGPTKTWGPEIPYVQARAYDALGDCAQAAALYETLTTSISNGKEDARERLQQLQCSQPSVPPTA